MQKKIFCLQVHFFPEGNYTFLSLLFCGLSGSTLAVLLVFRMAWFCRHEFGLSLPPFHLSHLPHYPQIVAKRSFTAAVKALGK